MKKNGDSYTFELQEGVVKIKIDGYCAISFLQSEYLGLYSSKEDRDWYSLDLYMKNGTIIETFWNDRIRWLKIIELIQDNL